MAYKVTPEFRRAVARLLDARAKADAAFANKLEAEGKSIDECCEFIVARAFAKKINAATPQEVEGWAVHYYDEERVDFSPAPRYSRVVVPEECAATIDAMEKEIPEEEREELRERARRRVIARAMAEMKEKRLSRSKVARPTPTPTLF